MLAHAVTEFGVSGRSANGRVLHGASCDSQQQSSCHALASRRREMVVCVDCAETALDLMLRQPETGSRTSERPCSLVLQLNCISMIKSVLPVLINRLDVTCITAFFLPPWPQQGLAPARQSCKIPEKSRPPPSRGSLRHLQSPGQDVERLEASSPRKHLRSHCPNHVLRRFDTPAAV